MWIKDQTPLSQANDRWDTELSVGVISIDMDHQALIESCDRLISMSERQLSWRDVQVAISELLASIEVHFICEEERFPTGYIDRDCHLKEHDTLREILSGLLTNQDGADFGITARTVRMLFIDHIRRFDQQIWPVR